MIYIRTFQNQFKKLNNKGKPIKSGKEKHEMKEKAEINFNHSTIQS